MSRVLLLALLLAQISMACDSDSGLPDPRQSPLIGDYVISDWTRNEAGCDAEGASILADAAEKRLVVQACQEPFFGTWFMHAYTCADEASCDQGRCTKETLPMSGYSFGSLDGARWAGTQSMAWGFEESGCEGTHEEQHIDEGATAGSVAIHVRTTEIAEVPCSDEPGAESDWVEAHASEHPCSSYEVIHGEPAP